jgi:peptidoglycan hydrolase-like protein with peptidoglycan-binding domain
MKIRGHLTSTYVWCPRLRAAVAAALVFACSHATQVAKTDESKGEARQPARAEGGAAEKPGLARRPEKPGRPPLAASPSGLFVPGGVGKLQKALADRGYLAQDEAKSGEIDEATSAAIRKFQADQGIARTGSPDHETVRRLGLDPDALFRKSAAVKNQ